MNLDRLRGGYQSSMRNIRGAAGRARPRRARRRKNMSMRMATKTTNEGYNWPKQEIYGRSSSDITNGKERIYERSYY